MPTNPPSPRSCRSCGGPVPPGAIYCNDCAVRLYLFKGDEEAFNDFLGLQPQDIARYLEANPQDAYLLLHDESLEQRLQRAGHRLVHFSPQVAKAIETIVNRFGAGVHQLHLLAAKLFAVSRMTLGGGSGSWLIRPKLSDTQRRMVVKDIGEGEFEVPCQVTAGELVQLVAERRCSSLPQHAPDFFTLTGDAARLSLDILCRPAELSAIAQLNACLVHAAACVPSDDDFRLADLAAAGGTDIDTLQAMGRELVEQGSITRLSRPGAGRRDIAELEVQPEFRRARAWLRFDLDLAGLDRIDRLCAELPQQSDPWVRWAYETAISGSTNAPMLGLLEGLGEERRTRAVVLDRAMRAGLLNGAAALAAFRSETAAAQARGYELQVFSKLFELWLQGRGPEGSGDILKPWFEAARSEYFRSAAALNALPSVAQLLRDLLELPDQPRWLVDLAQGLADFEWKQQRTAANAAGALWLFELVEQAIPERSDPKRSAQAFETLRTEDRAMLAELARRAQRGGGGAPWYTLDLGEDVELRLREAAFAANFLDEAGFRPAIVKHVAQILASRDIPVTEQERVKSLSERCARFMLGRLKNAQPRSRTLEAFRLGDWRGMLEGERVVDLSLPMNGVPQSIPSPVAIAAWSMAILLTIVLLCMVFLGGASPQASASAGNRPADGAVKRWAEVRPAVLQLDPKEWSPVQGSPRYWVHRMTADELTALVPECPDGPTGKVQRAVAEACKERMQASLAGYKGIQSPGSSGPAVTFGTIVVRIPHDGEAERGGWTAESADNKNKLERRPVDLVIEFPEGHTGA